MWKALEFLCCQRPRTERNRWTEQSRCMNEVEGNMTSKDIKLKDSCNVIAYMTLKNTFLKKHAATNAFRICPHSSPTPPPSLRIQGRLILSPWGSGKSEVHPQVLSSQVKPPSLRVNLMHFVQFDRSKKVKPGSRTNFTKARDRGAFYAHQNRAQLVVHRHREISEHL